MACYDLDSILHIDGRYIKSECFAGEFRDILETLNSCILPDQFHETLDSDAHTIKDGSNPVKYGSPEINPSNEVKIIGPICFVPFKYVIYGLVEDGDGTSDPRDQ